MLLGLALEVSFRVIVNILELRFRLGWDSELALESKVKFKCYCYGYSLGLGLRLGKVILR